MARILDTAEIGKSGAEKSDFLASVLSHSCTENMEKRMH